ncbi:unnamed protein product [Lota lota]
MVDEEEEGTEEDLSRQTEHGTMWLFILVLHLWLVEAQEFLPGGPCLTHNTYRSPENEDIAVNCNTEYMELSIFLCPIYQSLYNESLMALNGEFGKRVCHGIADWNADPPVLKFKVSINESAEGFCNSKTMITSEIGTGLFSDFSNVQFVNIWGFVNSQDPSAGIITYRKQIMYKFSCLYPLQYLVNNTKLGVSGVSLAVRDNNGSFISTLSMTLYNDASHTTPLVVPESGLNLKTRIFVGVKATNLTDRFNVLLDRCFATTSPSPTNNTFYDLFVGCTKDGQTVLEMNGVSQMAFFSFEAFRFVEHKNRTVSTFYLHCITRLCEVDNCLNLMPICPDSRRRRDVTSEGDSADNLSAIVSSPAILVSQQTVSSASRVQPKATSRAVVGLGVAVAALALLFGLVVLIFLRSRKNKK